MSPTDGLAGLSAQVVGMVVSLAVVTAVVLRARLVGLLADGLMVMAAVTMAAQHIEIGTQARRLQEAAKALMAKI